jgi:hypothetical protein
MAWNGFRDKYNDTLEDNKEEEATAIYHLLL